MKLYRSFVAIVALFVLITTAGAQNNEGEKLYQEALFYMEGMGNYAEAIERFETVAREHADNQPLAARALLMMGKCHEKLGRQEAKDAYNRIIENYGDQREVVLEARTRLLALSERTQKSEAYDLTVSRIWAGDDVDVLGSVSPDESYLSFVDWSTGDLAIREQSTGDTRRLTDKGSWIESNEHALYNIFSPDGKYIAYAWFDEEKIIYDLRIVNVETEEVAVLYADEDIGYVQPYDWSPDGQYIVMILSRGDLTYQMGLLSVQDGSLAILKSLDWRYPVNIVFSPDGQFLAYDFPPFEDFDERNIYLIDVEHQRESVLIDHRSENIALGWSPGGDHLLFMSDRAGTRGIWLLPMENGNSAGEPRMMKSNIGQTVLPLALTGNGSFYYGLATGGRDVYQASLDFGNDPVVGIPERVSQRFVGMNRTPDWSPDGNKIAYSSTRNLRRAHQSNSIIIHSVETGQERTLSPEIHYIFDRLRWSSDGESIIVTGAAKPNRRGIYIIDAISGEVTNAIDSDPTVHKYRPELSPDGDYLYYFKNVFATNTAQLISHDMVTQKEAELYAVPLGERSFGNMAISSDGHYLAFTESTRKDRKLQVISLQSDTIEPRTVFTVSEPEVISQILSFDGNEVSLLVREDTSEDETIHELMTVDIKTGAARKIAALDFLDTVSNIRLHPDGESIVFNMGPRLNHEIWTIDNLLPESDVAEK